MLAPTLRVYLALALAPLTPREGGHEVIRAGQDPGRVGGFLRNAFPVERYHEGVTPPSGRGSLAAAPAYRAASPSEGRAARSSALQIALVLFVALAVVVAAAVYAVISGVFVRPPPPDRPVIVSSSVELWPYQATFRIVSASRDVEPRNYRVNLAVNGVSGAAIPLPVNVSGTVTAGGDSYSIAWSDPDRNFLVSQADQFAVSPSPYGNFRSDRTFVFHLLWSDGTTIQSASWQTPPESSKPVITFGAVTLTGTTATFSVADVSQAVSPSSYRFNLQANTTFGTARALGTSGTGVAVTVGGVTHTVTYTDIGGDATVNAGDQFSVAGLLPATYYKFMLLWSDGSQIQERSWSTP